MDGRREVPIGLTTSQRSWLVKLKRPDGRKQPMAESIRWMIAGFMGMKTSRFKKLRVMAETTDGGLSTLLERLTD